MQSTTTDSLNSIYSTQGNNSQAWLNLKSQLQSNPNEQNNVLNYMRNKIQNEIKNELNYDILDYLLDQNSNIILSYVSSQEFLNNYITILKKDYGASIELQKKVLYLIQKWAIKYKNNNNCQIFNEYYNYLKSNGIFFPPVGDENVVPTYKRFTSKVEKESIFPQMNNNIFDSNNNNNLFDDNQQNNNNNNMNQHNIQEQSNYYDINKLDGIPPIINPYEDQLNSNTNSNSAFDNIQNNFSNNNNNNFPFQNNNNSNYNNNNFNNNFNNDFPFNNNNNNNFNNDFPFNSYSNNNQNPFNANFNSYQQSQNSFNANFNSFQGNQNSSNNNNTYSSFSPANLSTEDYVSGKNLTNIWINKIYSANYSLDTERFNSSNTNKFQATLTELTLGQTEIDKGFKKYYDIPEIRDSLIHIKSDLSITILRYNQFLNGQIVQQFKTSFPDSERNILTFYSNRKEPGVIDKSHIKEYGEKAVDGIKYYGGKAVDGICRFGNATKNTVVETYGKIKDKINDRERGPGGAEYGYNRNNYSYQYGRDEGVLGNVKTGFVNLGNKIKSAFQ